VAASIWATRRLALAAVVMEGTVPLVPPDPAHCTSHWMVAITVNEASLGCPSGEGIPIDDRV